MKKKVLLTSIATIALCLCLIAGSTFALFTSTSNVNIAVTAGKVNMVAGIAITSVESVTGSTTGTVTDENGATYDWTHSDTDAPFNFINGGSAEVTGSVLTIDKITPGDRINLAVSGKNNSNVAIKYRYIVECIIGYKLMDGLVVEVGGGTYESLASYTSDWAELAAGTDMTTENITITLPVNAGNEYQEQETEIKVTVEAVQGNGVVENKSNPVVYIPKVTDATALADALADPEIPAINILADIPATVEVNGLSNKTIWVNGNDVAFNFTGKVENVVIDGIVCDDDSRSSVNVGSVEAGSNITILNSEFLSATGPANASIFLSSNVDVTVDNCVFTKGSGKGYGIRGNSGADLTVTNCEFYDYSSWAIIVNGKADGDVIIDNCYFDTDAGVFKTLADGITGDFVFTNNTMIAPGDGGNISKVVVSGSSNGPIICAGTVTSENNTLNGEAWTVTVSTNN